jgi:hypothetical protein
MVILTSERLRNQYRTGTIIHHDEGRRDWEGPSIEIAKEEYAIKRKLD